MVEFGILGPFEVVEGGRVLALGGLKQRALLALLLLHRGEVVSTDGLIDALWGERVPPTAAKTVQVFVSNLRKVLGEGVLVTRGHGYVLQIEPGQIDVDRFDWLVGDGRGALRLGDPQRAADALREALSLWRGPPLSDFTYEGFAQSEIGRLEEERLATLEDRIEAELALGEHRKLVSELEGLVREHPMRERLQGQLMLALYRCGRQADALECYQRARRGLVDELGLEPGPELKEMERGILAHDPRLQAPPRASALARRVQRGGAVIMLGAVASLAASVLAAVKLSGPGTSAVRVTANSVAAIDPRSDRVVGVAPVGSRPGPIAFGSGSLWVGNVDDESVSRVDPGTMQAVKTIPVGDPPTGVVVSDGWVWVGASTLSSDLASTARAALVSRIDPQFDTIASTTRLQVAASGPVSVAAQRNGVWAAPSAGVLTRLNAGDGRTLQRLDPNSAPSAIATGDGAVWMTDTVGDDVTRVGPNGVMSSIVVGNGPSALAVGAGGVWVADSLDNSVVRIDAATRAVTKTIRVGHSPAGVAVGAGSVWVANSGDGTVSRIDPRTERVVATIAVGGSPAAVTVAAGRVWVTVDARLDRPSGGGAERGTLRIDTALPVGTMDPALAGYATDYELLQATCANLVSFPDTPGPAALVPTPEVAASLPAVSADGRTYTFTIRPGFRFSPPSQQAVTAQTFKKTIERALNPRTKSAYALDFTDIVGAAAYIAGKAHHISGVVARGKTLAIRLLVPNPDLLSRLGEPPMCAVPSDTPIDPNGVNDIPMAGPYYIASYAPGQGIVLATNPNYHGSRPRHFARIELSVGVSTARAIAAVTADTADDVTVSFSTDLSPTKLAADMSPIAARYGPGSAAAKKGRQRYFLNPVAELDYFVFNTHRALFANARMRQAVSYAIDRRALAALHPPFPLHPTDHYLPAGMPGYRDVHVYPLTADPAKARALADGRGRTAVLYTCDADVCREQAGIVRADLAAIGLRVQIKAFSFPDYLPVRLARRGEPFDLAYVPWVADFPDPYAMVNEVLETGDLGPIFDAPIWQHELAAAARLSGPERYLTYGKLDIDLARYAAPLLAFGNVYVHDLFSARIGCQTYGPYGFLDPAALCLRRP